MAPGLNQQVLEGFKAFRMLGESESVTLSRCDWDDIQFQHLLELLSVPSVPCETFIKACRAAVGRGTQC
jgi:hypothetical protein